MATDKPEKQGFFDPVAGFGVTSYLLALDALKERDT